MRVTDEPGLSTVGERHPSDIFEKPSLAILLERVARGDHKAFQFLYKRERPKLFGLAFRILRNPADAEDAVHDGLCQIWENAHRYNPALGSAGSWINAIVRYRSLAIRDHQLHPWPSEAFEEIEDIKPNPLAQIEGKLNVESLRKHLQNLDPSTLQVFRFAFYEDMSYSSVADRVSKPIGTIKSHIRRTLKHLRLQLGD